MLIDDLFNIDFQIKEFSQVLSNFKSLNMNLSASFDSSENIQVKGLIGTDLIQFLQPINTIKCMNGSAFELYNGISPFGNILHFLHNSQMKPVKFNKNNILEKQEALSVNNTQSHNYHNVLSNYADFQSSKIEFVINPINTYLDILDQQFSDSCIERKLEYMFNLDSVEDCISSISEYDQYQINKF